MLSSCSQKKQAVDNPFLKNYETTYGIPPFEKIENKHYMPAFDAGISEQKAEIEKIVSNTDAPTFENTILAMEYSGKLLTKVSQVFFNLTEANTNDELQNIAKEISPKLSLHEDEILLNDKLFQRVKAVYDQKDKLSLNQEQAKLLEETYKNFIRSGANLTPEQKERIKKINEE